MTKGQSKIQKNTEKLHFFHRSGSDSAEKKPDSDPPPDPTINRTAEINIFILYVGRHEIRYYKPSFYD